MTPKIKKIIAREGLVLMGVLTIGIACTVLSVNIHYQVKKPVSPPEFKGNIKWDEYKTRTIDDQGRSVEKNFGQWYLKEENQPLRILTLIFGYIATISFFFAYPAYLLIRFIIWMIKTLKGK